MPSAFSNAFASAFGDGVMANSLRIAYSNFADAAILSSSGSTLASLPASNMKDEDIERVWRSASTDSAQLIVLADLGQTRIIEVVALINCNVLTPATFHVRVSTVDSTGVAGDAYNVSGITGIASAEHNKFVHFIQPQVSGRYVRINASGLTAAPEAGRLSIDNVWFPSRNVSLVSPPEEIPIDHTRVSYSLGGNRFQDIRTRQRRYRFVLRGIPDAEKTEHIDKIILRRGIGREILVCFDADSSDLGRASVWGNLISMLNPRRMADTSDLWECEFELEERI